MQKHCRNLSLNIWIKNDQPHVNKSTFQCLYTFLCTQLAACLVLHSFHVAGSGTVGLHLHYIHVLTCAQVKIANKYLLNYFFDWYEHFSHSLRHISVPRTGVSILIA